MKRNGITGLYAIIDSSLLSLDNAGECARKLVDAGVRLIQLRAKGEGSLEVLAVALAMRSATKDKALFIINVRVDIAMLSGADGVHLGQSDIPLIEARRLMPNALIGVSTHNLEEAAKAASLGADYISYGPIFATKTKKDADIPKGLEGLKALAPSVNIPIVAIGGITVETAASVIEAGASAIAVISDILLADDIKSRTSEIISRIDRKGT